MMLTFAEAFNQAFNEASERRRQEEGLRSLIDLLGEQEESAKKIKTANSLYDTNQSWQATNPAIKAGGYKFDNALSGGNNSRSGFQFSDLLAPGPSFKDNLSLGPSSREAEPEYDSAGMYDLLKKAVGRGIPASMALAAVPEYYAGKQAEQRAAANTAQRNKVLAGLNENTTPLELMKSDAQLRATGHPGLNGYGLTDLIKARQAQGINGLPGSQRQKNGQSFAPADSSAVWYDRKWRQIKSENPNMSDQDVTGYMTYLIKANGG